MSFRHYNCKCQMAKYIVLILYIIKVMRVPSKIIKNKGLFKHLIIEIEYKVGSLNQLHTT